MEAVKIVTTKLKLAHVGWKKKKAKFDKYVKQDLKGNFLKRSYQFTAHSSKWLANLSEALQLKLAVETNDISLVWGNQMSAKEWDEIAEMHGWGHHTDRAPSGSASRFVPTPIVFPPGYTPPEGFVGTVHDIREKTRQQSLDRNNMFGSKAQREKRKAEAQEAGFLDENMNFVEAGLPNAPNRPIHPPAKLDPYIDPVEFLDKRDLLFPEDEDEDWIKAEAGIKHQIHITGPTYPTERIAGATPTISEKVIIEKVGSVPDDFVGLEVIPELTDEQKGQLLVEAVDEVLEGVALAAANRAPLPKPTPDLDLPKVGTGKKYD